MLRQGAENQDGAYREMWLPVRWQTSLLETEITATGRQVWFCFMRLSTSPIVYTLVEKGSTGEDCCCWNGNPEKGKEDEIWYTNEHQGQFRQKGRGCNQDCRYRCVGAKAKTPFDSLRFTLAREEKHQSGVARVRLLKVEEKRGKKNVW